MTKLNSQKNTEPFFKRHIISIILVSVFAMLILVPGYFIYQFGVQLGAWGTNHAAEVARPIEKELEKAGAVKKCSQGYGGYGASDLTPHYSANYQFEAGEAGVLKYINEIAKKNGFSIIHEPSPYDSINHYIDQSSISSPYSDLEEGKISITFSVYTDTDKKPLVCADGTTLLGDETHTAISMGVSLSTRKH